MSKEDIYDFTLGYLQIYEVQLSLLSDKEFKSSKTLAKKGNILIFQILQN